MARGLYTETLARKIAALVEQGETLTAAARANGIKPQTAHNWARYKESFRNLVMAARGDTDTATSKTGRQPVKTEATLEQIATDHAQGKPLRKIADEIGHNLATIYRWEAENPSFHESMLSARRMYAHSLVAESLEIADDQSQDILERDGKVHFNSTKIKRDQLRVQTRWRTAAAFNPEAYGERKGGAGGVQVNITLSTEDKASIERYLEIADSIPGEPVED